MSDRIVPLSPEDIKNRFNYHPPKDIRTKELHETVRDACNNFAHYLVDNLPPCRELSLAITHLEEVMMWSNAAIARHNNNEGE